MIRLLKIGYWCILGVPSLLYLLVGSIAAMGACAFPQDHWLCPAFSKVGLAVAYAGFLALIPFTLIGLIWLVVKIAKVPRADS